MLQVRMEEGLCRLAAVALTQRAVATVKHKCAHPPARGAV